MVKVCEHCGSILEENLFSTRLRNDIYNYIRKHPDCTIDEIRDYAYRNDRDGGPLSNSLGVTLHHMKADFRKLGIKLENRTGRGATYRLVAIKEEQ